MSDTYGPLQGMAESAGIRRSAESRRERQRRIARRTGPLTPDPDADLGWPGGDEAAESDLSDEAAAAVAPVQKPAVDAGQDVSAAESDDAQVVLQPRIGHQI